MLVLIMSALLDKVRKETQALSADEMLLLGVELIDRSCTPCSESEQAVSDAWDGEIRQRVEDIRAGRVKLVPWDEVVAQTDARFGWDK